MDVSVSCIDGNITVSYRTSTCNRYGFKCTHIIYAPFLNTRLLAQPVFRL
nr:MAG TPA: hypothetical protein [Caudoviricetes sp.]